MKPRQYLEDLAVGQKYGSNSRRIDIDAIKRFAAEFDPQPFHLDEHAAAESFFQGLAASGWHTAALTMRLVVDSDFNPAGGLIGASLDELRWPRPTRPGDVLSVESEVLELRPSRSQPDRGLAKVRVTTRNQHHEAVQVYVVNLVVRRRDPRG